MTPLATRRLAVSASLLLGGCQEEALTTLTATISVCADDDAPQAQCDRPIDLGQVPVSSDVALALVVREVGGARLDLLEVTSSDPALVFAELPAEVFPRGQVPLPFTLSLPADALGPRAITVVITSNDPNTPQKNVELVVEGVPKLAPDILVCVGDDESACGTDLDVSFGVVRRTQESGLTLTVKNVGNTPLSIEGVRLEGAASVADELTIATSTRPAQLAADGAAPLVVTYRPRDSGTDEVTLVISSDDEDTPEVSVRLRGEAEPNEPPLADAIVSTSASPVAEVRVEDAVQLDGNASFDPEGDPLLYTWQLTAPSGSAAVLDDPTAVRATFVPDVVGTYEATLVVRDSLGQSSGAATATVTALARFGFRARATWSGGADVDVHVVEQGAALFSTQDCNFQNRNVDFGVVGVSADDCLLLDDATGPPGGEQAIIAAPTSGAYEIWAHVFEDGGAGAVPTTVRVILDDAAVPALLVNRTLSGDCASWHVANIELPSGIITLIDEEPGAQCP